MSVGPVGVVEDSEGSRPIYIKYVEGLGSPEATPNLDVESRGPNYTTILWFLFPPLGFFSTA